MGDDDDRITTDPTGRLGRVGTYPPSTTYRGLGYANGLARSRRRRRRPVRLVVPVVVLAVVAAAATYLLLRGEDEGAVAVLASAPTTVTSPATTVPFAPAEGVWGVWPEADKETIELGDEGDAVAYLQGVLRQQGARIMVDGVFGPQTEQAVRDLQVFVQLEVDGRVGPQTWQVIDDLARTGAAGA